MKSIPARLLLKKSVTFLAATIAAASVLAVDATPKVKAYGSIRMGIDLINADTEDDGANGRDYLSRIGLKATTQITESLKGVGVVEYGTRDDNLVDFNQNGDPTLRLHYVGLEGAFGKIYYGSQTLLWHKFVRGAYFSDGNDTLRMVTIRDDDLLQYYYSVGGFTFGASAQFERQDGDSVDQIQFGGEYKAGGLKLQAAYAKDNQGDNTGGTLGLRAWYTAGPFTVSAFHHASDDDFDKYGGNGTGNVRLRDASINGNVNGVTSCGGEDRTTNGIYGRVKFGSNQVHARYAVNDCDVSGDVSSAKVEYIRFLNKKFRLWTAFETLDSDDTRLPSTGEDMSEIQLGARLDF